MRPIIGFAAVVIGITGLVCGPVSAGEPAPRGEVPAGFGPGDLAADFGAGGLWRYGDETWSPLTTADPEEMTACCDGLSADFGAGKGLWLYADGAWSLLSVADPAEMVCWSGRLAVRFDPPRGFWLYDCSADDWDQMTTSEPEGIAATAAALYLDYGSLGLWSYDSTGWEKITPADAEEMEAGPRGPGVGPYATGQTECWDGSGAPVPCAGTGQDGEYRMGTPAPTPRFTDSGDGTVTDNLTELIFLQDANCFGFENWDGALAAANSLAEGSCGLTDGSAAGDWRLPNVREMLSLYDHGRHDPALAAGHPFLRVQPFFYWSSTTRADASHYAWGIGFNVGGTGSYLKTGNGCLLPVRGPR